MTSEHIHRLAKAFFYAMLIIAAGYMLAAVVIMLAPYIFTKWFGIAAGFCWLWYICYMFLDIREKRRQWKEERAKSRYRAF